MILSRFCSIPFSGLTPVTSMITCRQMHRRTDTYTGDKGRPLAIFGDQFKEIWNGFWRLDVRHKKYGSLRDR